MQNNEIYISIFSWALAILLTMYILDKTKKNDHVSALFHYFNSYILPSIKNIRVISFSLISIVLIGGAGIWLPWIRSEQTSALLPGANVFTFCLALLGSLICEKLFFYTKKYNKITEFVYGKRSNKEKYLIDLKYHLEQEEFDSIISAWGLLFGATTLILVIISYAKFYNSDSFFGFFGLVFSISIYIFSIAPEIDKKSKIESKDDEPAGPMLDEIEENIDSNFFSDAS